VAGDADTLRTWAVTWDGGGGNADLFRPELLDDPTTSVLAGQAPDGRVVAGAVASHSDQVLGISNVLALDGGPGAAWSVLLDAAHWLVPHAAGGRLRARRGPGGSRLPWLRADRSAAYLAAREEFQN
jgi:hypothetical protein